MKNPINSRDQQIDRYCKRLAKAWKAMPDQRFIQLVINANEWKIDWGSSDFELLHKIEKFCGVEDK